VPRDRDSSFEPQLVKKGQTRFDGLDEKIISLYSRGMTQREIQGHLEEIYGVEILPSLVSTVTDAVLDEVRAWQSRPLDSVYPILYLDALQVKVKSQWRVQNKAIYLAFGVNLQGLKEVLGMWAADNEGAKFWMQVITELKNRGVQDIFIACVDGLKGFPEAIEAVYPQTQVQLCMVHLVRHALSYVSHKDRKAVADGLKEVYQAVTVEEAERQLAEFEETWAESYPVIARRGCSPRHGELDDSSDRAMGISVNREPAHCGENCVGLIRREGVTGAYKRKICGLRSAVNVNGCMHAVTGALVERRIHNPKVGSSSLPPATTYLLLH